MRTEPEGDETTEAVADDNRMVELLGADVSREVIADSLEKWSRDARLSGETCQGQHMALVMIFQMLDGSIPDRTGARKAGDQNLPAALCQSL